MAYSDAFIEKRKEGDFSTDVTILEVYNKMLDSTKEHIYTIDGTSSIRLLNSEQSSITLLNDSSAIGSTGTAGQNTVEIELKEESSSKAYWVEVDGIYYPINIGNSGVELDIENSITSVPEGSGVLGSGIEITYIDSGKTEESNESDFVTAVNNGTKITVTAKTGKSGSTQLVIRDGTVELMGNISVTVNPTYTIKTSATNGSISLAVNGQPTTSKKYGEGVELTLTAEANKYYEFEKWNDDNGATYTRKVTVNEESVTVTYTAIFKDTRIYGANVYLNSGNRIVMSGNRQVQDNWKLFYIDDDDKNANTTEYVHLIYGDYYSASYQNGVTSGSLASVYVPAYREDTGYKGGSYTCNASSVDTLVKYLKNNSGYSYISDLDSLKTDNAYSSWSDLKSALTSSDKILSGINILVQGSPSATMWAKSWNEQNGSDEIEFVQSNGGFTSNKTNRSVVSEKDGLYRLTYSSSGPNGYWLSTPAIQR